VGEGSDFPHGKRLLDFEHNIEQSFLVDRPAVNRLARALGHPTRCVAGRPHGFIEDWKGFAKAAIQVTPRCLIAIGTFGMLRQGFLSPPTFL
jgi:hypothetical protein